jgi:hypothetical protein
MGVAATRGAVGNCLKSEGLLFFDLEKIEGKTATGCRGVRAGFLHIVRTAACSSLP